MIGFMLAVRCLAANPDNTGGSCATHVLNAAPAQTIAPGTDRKNSSWRNRPCAPMAFYRRALLPSDRRDSGFDRKQRTPKTADVMRAFRSVGNLRTDRMKLAAFAMVAIDTVLAAPNAAPLAVAVCLATVHGCSSSHA